MYKLYPTRVAPLPDRSIVQNYWDHDTPSDWTTHQQPGLLGELHTAEILTNRRWIWPLVGPSVSSALSASDMIMANVVKFHVEPMPYGSVAASHRTRECLEFNCWCKRRALFHQEEMIVTCLWFPDTRWSWWVIELGFWHHIVAGEVLNELHTYIPIWQSNQVLLVPNVLPIKLPCLTYSFILETYSSCTRNA